MKMKFFGMAACLAVALSSCCGCRVSNSKQKKMLTMNEWKLVELKGDRAFAGDSEESYTLAFDGEKGRISGQGACNRYFGSYNTSDKNTILLQPGGMTLMACRNGENETVFMRTLGEADEFGFDDGNLVLLKGGEVIAKFEPAE